VFVGLPYDVMGHAILMSLFSGSLDVPLGTMHVTLAHPHLYESHFDQAREMVKYFPVKPYFEMPQWTLQEAILNPDLFVKHYEETADKCDWPEYCPRPEVIV